MPNDSILLLWYFFDPVVTLKIGMFLNAGYLALWRTLPGKLDQTREGYTNLAIVTTIGMVYWGTGATLVFVYTHYVTGTSLLRGTPPLP